MSDTYTEGSALVTGEVTTHVVTLTDALGAADESTATVTSYTFTSGSALVTGQVGDTHEVTLTDGLSASDSLNVSASVAHEVTLTDSLTASDELSVADLGEVSWTSGSALVTAQVGGEDHTVELTDSLRLSDEDHDAQTTIAVELVDGLSPRDELSVDTSTRHVVALVDSLAARDEAVVGKAAALVDLEATAQPPVFITVAASEPEFHGHTGVAPEIRRPASPAQVRRPARDPAIR